MSKLTRVNVTAKVNTATIRRERRAGRDVIIVPSATLPDNIVMNGVRYPAEEIARSFNSLNRTPAPLGHPSVEGAFVSAKDPEGLARGWIGAWNENVRRETDPATGRSRVYLDKVIDVEQASQLTGGKAVLAAIEKGEPIHTSTGLYAMMEPLQDAPDGAEMLARDIVFDHDAILLGEAGAATPEQGVGMLVNKAVSPTGEQVTVINSSMEDDAEERVDWAVGYLAEALERRKKAGALSRMKTAIMEALGLSGEYSGREPEATQQKDAYMADEKQLEALSATVNALTESVAQIAQGLKTLTDAQAAQAQAIANQEQVELADLRAKIIKANLLDEAAAAELTINAARALAKAAVPGKAAPIANGILPQPQADGFKLPKQEA